MPIWYEQSAGYLEPPSQPDGPWEDDEPGDVCSACKGYGDHENPDTEETWECWVCNGTGVAQ